MNFIQYSEALDFIHGIARFGSKLGLERVSELLRRTGRPQDKLKFAHVAGTNGKGSTCAMLSRILTESGYKTGLYISPYVLDFRERIQIDSEMISENDLTKSAVFVREKWEEMNSGGNPPTEFEVVLAIALHYFAEQKCDVVVLEVGLGGRLDATNAIDTPLCSVITSIGIDHTEILGETIAEIAAEKCGIIKPDGITVAYPRQEAAAFEVITKFCAERKNRLMIPSEPEVLSADISGSRIRYDGIDIFIPLPGEHQIYNAVTVVEAVKALRLSGCQISDSDVAAGISKTRFPSRLEMLCEKPLTLLDGAHNLSGAQALSRALGLLGKRRIHAVAAFMSDKDADGIFREILPRCCSVTVCSVPLNPRSMPAKDAAGYASKYCGNVYQAGTLAESLLHPVSMCGDGDAIVIFGSLYFAAEIRPLAQELIRSCR